jgi:hypothetical protein
MTVTPSADVERALAIGRDLSSWWTDVEAGLESVERFVLAPGFPGGDAVRGFFGDVRAGGSAERYMGYASDYFFDLAGGTAADRPEAAAWLVNQAEEFALRYWLRAEAWALPEPYVDMPRPVAPELAGFTNLMQAFKTRADGAVGRFPDAIARAIVDLRELETRYEWITLRRSARDLHVSLAVPGSSTLSVSAPLAASSTLALHADLTVRRRLPGPGIIGEFGAGFCPVPPAGLQSLVGDFGFLQTGLRRQTLRVYDTGEMRLRAVTIMRRWTAPLESVAKRLLRAHATHLRDQLLGTRDIWQQVSNWLDASSIPGWLLQDTHAQASPWPR